MATCRGSALLLVGVVEAMNLREREAILMDTQAGVEHFGRALAKGFHHALVVCDPTFNAVQVAVHAAGLAAEMTDGDAPLYWKGTDVLERLGVTHHRAACRAVDPGSRQVELTDGATLDYDRLVIATGSRLHAEVPGVELAGVHDFKSLRTATALVERAQRGEVTSACIVGAGFIGVEVALLLADLGLKVTIISRRWVMPRGVDPETGEVVRAALQARGVTVLQYQPAATFEGDIEVEALRLSACR